MSERRGTKIFFLALLLIVVALFFSLHLNQYLSLEFLKSNQAKLQAHFQNEPVQTILVFSLFYIIVTAITLPGPVILTLVAGAIFGLYAGTIIVSFASSIGAVFAFLISRFLLRDSVQKRIGARIEPINRGLERDGPIYLLALRLNPVFPFFIVNYALGLTRVSLWRYYFFTQIGTLASTIVYVNAGTQIGEIDSVRGILDPGLIFSLAILSILPLLARIVIGLLQWRREAIEKARLSKPNENPPPAFP